MHIELDHGSSVLLSDSSADLLGLLARLLESGLVDVKSDLSSHELGEIDGESVGVVESPDILSRERLGSGVDGGLGVEGEELLSSVEGSRK